MPAKIIQMLTFNTIILYKIAQNFVRFHVTEYKIGLSQEFEKKRNSSAHYRATCIRIVISHNICFVYKFLCSFILWKPRSVCPENSRKCVATAPPVERITAKVDGRQCMLE